MSAAFLALAIASGALAEDVPAKSSWTDCVSVFGAIDARAEYYALRYDRDVADRPGNVRESNVYVYAAGLGVKVEPVPYVSALASLFTSIDADRDEGEFAFDDGELYVSFQYPWTVTPYAVIGRLYLPVGDYSSFTASDPLTLALTQTWKTAIGAGARMKWFDAGVWGFNGEFDRVDRNGDPKRDLVDEFVARLDVYPLAFQEDHELAVGAYFLSDATETVLDAGNAYFAEGARYERSVPLWGVYLTLNAPFTEMFGLDLAGEFASTGRFGLDEMTTPRGRRASIWATNAEAALLIRRETFRVGARFEQVHGVDWLGTQGNDPSYEVTDYAAASGFAGATFWEDLRIDLQYRYGWDNEHNVDETVIFRTLLEW